MHQNLYNDVAFFCSSHARFKIPRYIPTNPFRNFAKRKENSPLIKKMLTMLEINENKLRNQ